jgi:hypothetical protein
VLLNVSRKGREWRLEELVSVRPAPLDQVAAAVQAMRALVKADERVVHGLHRRVFLHRITPDGYELLLSFYVDAGNRDQFLAAKEDFLQAFADILRRHGLRLAAAARVVELQQPPARGVSPLDLGIVSRRDTSK